MTPEQATTQHDKLVAAKLAHGYRLAIHDPRHPQLEAVIARDPETAAHYAVYGDWLESQGDPRGRLIALQLAAGEDAPASVGAAAAKHFKEHADYLLGPLAGYVRPAEDEEVFTWRFGFIHQAYLHADRQMPLDRALGQLLRAPSGRFLVNLAMGRNARMQEAVAVLARHAPPSLRALRLWNVEDLDLRGVWARAPQLRRLVLSGRGFALGELELPRLERLELVDATMANATLKAIARAPWPALQQLRIDFGRVYLTGDASIDELFALLARPDLGAVAQLAVVHTRYVGELIRELVSSPLADRLEHLDLSNNLMEDRHAAELATHRARFPQLAHLDVSRNELTATGHAALEGFAPSIRT